MNALTLTLHPQSKTLRPIFDAVHTCRHPKLDPGNRCTFIRSFIAAENAAAGAIRVAHDNMSVIKVAERMPMFWLLLRV
jgi:hypothetical protein